MEKGRNQKDRAVFEARMEGAMLLKNHWDDHWETWKEACEYVRANPPRVEGELRHLVDGQIWSSVMEGTAHCGWTNRAREGLVQSVQSSVRWALDNAPTEPTREQVLSALRDCIEGLEGHFGQSFWESPLGKRVAPFAEKGGS